MQSHICRINSRHWKFWSADRGPMTIATTQDDKFYDRGADTAEHGGGYWRPRVWYWRTSSGTHLWANFQEQCHPQVKETQEVIPQKHTLSQALERTRQSSDIMCWEAQWPSGSWFLHRWEEGACFAAKASADPLMHSAPGSLTLDSSEV
jgi:hypothetical protein